MKIMDKLKIKVKLDKKILLFLLILLIIGITVVSIFVTILNQSDKSLVSEHLNDFLNSVEGNKLDFSLALKNNLVSNILYVLIIWLLGISVIGLPIIIFMFFSKTFILGFSVGAIISTFKTKGILFSLIYTFPGQVISLLFLIILVFF